MSGETDAAPTELAPAEAASAEISPAELSPADAACLVRAVKPAALLALLKDPDFRAAIVPAFAGFRPDPKSLANPTVRGRLAQAAAKDEKLAEKLRSLPEAAPKPASAAAPQSAPPAPPPPAKPDPVPALKAELAARRKERDAARSAQAAAERERDEAAKARAALEAERDDARSLAKKQADRIARLERQAARSAQTEARLVKALNQDKVSPGPALRPRSAGPGEPLPRPVSPAWPDAVRHLLDKAKFDAALALADDVLKTDSSDLDALQISVRALEGRGEPRAALAAARRLLAEQVRRDDYAAATDTFFLVLRLASPPAQAEPDARLFLAEFPAADDAAVAAARLGLGRLRGTAPSASEWLTTFIETRTALAPALMPPPGALGPDDPLPLPLKLGRPVTARLLTDAVDKGLIGLIEAARPALTALKAADPEASARVWAALTQAAADDPARLLPLQRPPRGAAVVDGSNVAWFDQESLARGLPRFRHLTAIRRALWARGFFPVVLYADANLPYFIDDRAALLGLRDRQALTLVDAGTTADEVLLREAQRLGALLVTNDKMEDWDPERRVRKVRYTVSLSGEAHLLSGI